MSQKNDAAFSAENAENTVKKSKEKLTKSQLIKKQKRQRALKKIIGIAAAVVLAIVLIVSVVLFAKSVTPALDSTVSVRSDNYKLTNATAAYFLYNYVNQYANTYSDYLSMLGLDLSASLKTQQFSEDMTWFDYFMNQTKSGIAQNIAWASAAKEAGYTLDEEDKQIIEANIDAIKGYAKTYGYTVDGYLGALFVNGVTEKSVREGIALQLLAEKYQNDVYAAYEFTAADYDKYLEENPSSLKKAELISYRVSADYEADAAQEIIDEAMADARTVADHLAACKTVEELEKAIFDRLKESADEDDTDEDIQAQVDALTTTKYYDDTTDDGKWYSVEERKVGDTRVIENTTSHYYTVWMVKEPLHIDTKMSIQVRHILLSTSTYGSDDAAKAKAEEILADWNAGEKTEDSFGKLAKEFSEDDATAVNGGLVEHITVGSTTSEFDAWCYADGRKAGDADIVKTDYGYHIVYYIGDDDLMTWQVNADSALKNQKYNDDTASLKEKFPTTFDDKKLNYIPGT